MAGQPGSDLTKLLHRWQGGDSKAKDEFLEQAYPELRKIAARHFRRQPRDHTLQATAVLHEAWLRLVKQDVDYQNRQHFFALLSTMMRRVLVDHARSRRRRGIATSMTSGRAMTKARPVDVLDLDAALSRLEEVHPFEARLVQLRYFAGLTIKECAETLDVGHATVERGWALARAFLTRELSPSR